jgi:hypothetical protein
VSLLDKSIDDFKNGDKSLEDLLDLIKKAQDPCIKEDCKEARCNCGGLYSTVFGSTPLRLKCASCSSEVFLRDLAKGLLAKG